VQDGVEENRHREEGGRGDGGGGAVAGGDESDSDRCDGNDGCERELQLPGGPESG